MTSRKPNLFIIGAMKSGTTSLHVYLDTHPEIFMSPQKEPSYFVLPNELHEIWPELERKKMWGDEGRYLALFESARDEKILGESSTAYTKLNKVTGVAERLFRFNRDARLIYLMRDPVQRSLSHYWHAVAHDGEYRGMVKALSSDSHYIEVSDYAMQLKPYFESFGPGQIRVLTTEEMLADPLGTMASLFQWLGVDPSHVPGNLARIENATPKEMVKASGFGVLYRFRNSRAWNVIEDLAPKSAKQWAKRRMTTAIQKSDDEVPAAVNLLRPILQERVLELQRLLDRSFPEWETLWRSG